VTATWKTGPHVLTYRQVTYTFAAVVAALCKDRPDGLASHDLAEITDALVEPSIAEAYKRASSPSGR
jgi:hypothetical protein